MNFEVNLIFLIKPFFLHDQKVVTKTLNILRRNRAFQMKLKALFIIFKGLSIKQVKQGFLEGDSPTLRTLILMTWVSFYLFFILELI